jgi:ABC-type lipoprotein export system ATPase subunit
MNHTYIECTSLSKRFEGKGKSVIAVDNVDLSILKNELMIIKGRSGAGKSTLLNLISGLLRPSTGSVRIGRHNISAIPNNELSRLLSNEVGMIFQSFNLLPTYSIYENIEVSLVPRGIGRKEIRKIVLPLLEKFQLLDMQNLLPPELSVGQQQKVAIVRTLAKDPSVILADEPTGSVDDETAVEIMDYFRLLKSRGKATVVIATHGTVPVSLADRMVLMENGKIG